MDSNYTQKLLEHNTSKSLEHKLLFLYPLEQKNSAIIAELLRNNFIIRDSASEFYDIANGDTLNDRNLALDIFEKCGYSWNSAISADQRYAAYEVNTPSGNSFKYYVDASSKKIIDSDAAMDCVVIFDSLDDLLSKSKVVGEPIEMGFYFSLKEGYA